MKRRTSHVLLVLLATLLVAPRVHATPTMPRAAALRTVEISPLGSNGFALARVKLMVQSQAGLVLLSQRDRNLLAAVPFVDEPERTQIVRRRKLSLYVPPAGSGGDLQGYENRILIWTPDDPGAYLPAKYTLTIMLSLADPAGHPIHAPPSGLSYTSTGQSDIVWSKPSETPILSASTTGNDRHLHGRPYLPELALYDYRARFYEPATSTFLELDPLGPVDSPNLYQAFGFDGLNVRDPIGLGGPFGDHIASQLAIRRSDLDEETKQELLRAQNEAEGRAVTTILRQIGIAQDWVEEQIVEHTPLNEADVSFLEVYTATNPEAIGEAARGLVTGVSKARTVLRESKVARKLVGLFQKGAAVESDAGAATYRPGDLLPDGRLLGDGPGAMLRSFVRSDLPNLPAKYAREFEGSVRVRTFKAGERVYRSPWVPREVPEQPGSWFGTRRTATKAGTDSMYQVAKWRNPTGVLRTYEFTRDTTVYYGRVKGGTGYQVLLPRDVEPSDVLKFIEERPLR